MVFKLKEPNQAVISEALKANAQHKKAVKDYFLGSNQFIGGDKASIADIMLVMTLQQTREAGVDNLDFSDYIARVREASDVASFDELEANVKELPQILKNMKML